MFFVVQIAVVLVLSSSVFAECWYPNGRNVSTNDSPCNPNALVSQCCGNGQACLSNGLCVLDPHRSSRSTHRGSCTDRTWNSQNCFKHCFDPDDFGSPVRSCDQPDNNTFCCGGGCQCNKEEFEVFTLAVAEVYTLTIIGEEFTNTHSSTTSPTTTTGSATTTTTTTPAPSSSTATPTDKADSDKDSSNATAIGAGVGGGIGGALLAAAVAFFLWRRKQKNSGNVPPVYPETGHQPIPQESPSYKYQRSELVGDSIVPPTYELESSPPGPK